MKLFFNRFYLDLRSLALMRILIAFLILCDIFLRICDIDTFFTDQGIFPRSVMIEEVLFPWSFSLFFISGHKIIIGLLFAVQALFAFSMLIGYRTRLSTFMSWLFILSLHDRTWFIINGGDDVLRCVLFYMMFLPLGGFLSCDRALGKITSPPKSYQYVSVWSLALMAQMGIVYFFSYLLKDHPTWRSDYTAVYYSLKLNLFVTPLGSMLSQYDLITKTMTFMAAKLEFLGPVVLFIHFFLGNLGQKLRLFIVLLFILFHVGLILCLNIGLFPYICIAIWIGILPSCFWKKKSNRGHQQKTTIFFDGDCLFCQKGVYLLNELFTLNTVIRPAQMNAKANEIMVKNNSWVVYDQTNDTYYTHFKAFVFLLKYSVFLKLVSFGFVQRFGEACYRMVSNKRKLASNFTKPFSFKTYSFKKNIFLELFSVVIIFTVLYWNLGTLPKVNFSNNNIKNVARYLHLYQEWNMFSPYPKNNNIWFEIIGEYSDGTKKEIVFKGDPAFEKMEENFIKKASTKHWRKLFLTISEDSRVSRYYGDYLCRLHTRTGGKVFLKNIDFMIYSQVNLLDHQKSGLSKSLQYRHACYK